MRVNNADKECDDKSMEPTSNIRIGKISVLCIILCVMSFVASWLYGDLHSSRRGSPIVLTIMHLFSFNLSILAIGVSVLCILRKEILGITLFVFSILLFYMASFTF